MGNSGQDSDKVLYEVADSVAAITLNRPEVLNALDMDMFLSLEACAQRAGSDPGVRAIVVAGQGRAFCSGLDTSMFAKIDLAVLQRCVCAFEESSKPTIAAVHGPSIGAGFELAVACDLRVAGANVRLAAAQVRLGVIPDLGATHRLPRLVGMGRARDMLMTGRDVGADEALSWGLVNRVVEATDATAQAIAWAKGLAGGPPLAISAVKRLVNGSLDHPVSEGLAQERDVQAKLGVSEDFREALTAMREKRAPRFQGR